MLYGGVPNLDPPAPEDEDHIIDALKQSGRVSSISLTVTSSLISKLSAISEPISELEDLTLLSHDNMQLALPTTFRWGTRLRTLHSVGIAFPSFPHLLAPCQDIVDLQLHEIPSAGYFSPETFADALSGMTQLRSITLHFLSFPHRRSHLSPPLPPGGRTVLSALVYLKYRGTSKYFDNFVARIDAPCLGDIDITFFTQPTMDASQLGRFIERIEVQTSLIRADIDISAQAISISFTHPSTSTLLKLQISCNQLDWQLSCMAQVCDQFSPFLSRVEELRINETQSLIGQNDVAGEQWVELVRPFGSARDFWMTDDLVTHIMHALGQADGDTTLLPALRYLSVEHLIELNEPSWDALQSFINLRALSGHPVKIDTHGLQITCSYCDHIVSMPGYDHQFWSHLVLKHPRVARKDVLLSNPLLTYPTALELGGLRRRHTLWLAPDEELE